MKGRGKGRGDWVHLMGLAAANHLLEVAPSAHNLGTMRCTQIPLLRVSSRVSVGVAPASQPVYVSVS